MSCQDISKYIVLAATIVVVLSLYNLIPKLRSEVDVVVIIAIHLDDVVLLFIIPISIFRSRKRFDTWQLLQQQPII